MARINTFLVIDSPGQSQQIIIWDTLEITVGRGPDRDLVIPDSEVSRQHALFAMDGASHIVADLHTSNGTFVNGARVSRHQLRPGDVVELGPARVQFRQETETPKGKNVRFASQLKSFTPFGSDEESGNRTVMGLPGAQGLVSAQGDYSDRSPQGEMEFDLGNGGATGNTPAAVVDLDSVLDGGLDAVQLASFEDEELTNLEKDPDDLPPVAPRGRAAPVPPPPQARPAPAPRPSAPRAPAPPPPAAAPAPAPRAAAPAQAPRAAAAAGEPSPSDTTARATLSIEIEGPRAVLKSVVASLLDREISIPPVKIRLRRPQ
jgi:pSer/pThr/pTyr-binding forkhead associated (FHA) protein